MSDDTDMPQGWQGQFLGEELLPAEMTRIPALFHVIHVDWKKRYPYGAGTRSWAAGYYRS